MYQKVIEFVRKEGANLVGRVNKLPSLERVGKFAKEKELHIERSLKELITGFGPEHSIYAEEENSKWPSTGHIWVVDPISGTFGFLRGLARYSIVVSHMVNSLVEFSLVYDPSTKELFSGYRNGGSFLNDRLIAVPESVRSRPSVILNLSRAWHIDGATQSLIAELAQFDLYRTPDSMAVNYCHVAAGRHDGVIALTKDSFAEFAGGLLIREAGGLFTDFQGQATVLASTRCFVGGNERMHGVLLAIARKYFPGS